MNRTIYFLFIFAATVVTAKAGTLKVPAEYPAIQAAINAAADGDTVLVAPGTYFENINFKGRNILVTSHFALNKDFSFITNTIIDGSNPAHPDTASCVLIISGEDSTAVLQGFTITGGKGTAWRDEHSSGTYREGGGIFTALSSPTIQYNLIINNEAINRTGLASAGGGGIRSGDGNLKIQNNIIMNNNARYGGGIVLNWCNINLRNNIIVGNTGGQDYGGGGIWINRSHGGSRVLENNTIMNNNSASDGGGILIYNSTTATLRNNIVYGNTANTASQISLRSGGAITATYNDIVGGWNGMGNIDADPMLSAANYYLRENSPCIDAGDPDARYNDPEKPGNPGLAEFPSLGTVRNDMGAFGGYGRNILPDIPTGVDENSSGSIIHDYHLYQNFPNPFNPATNLEFQIKDSELVTLKIYDLLGRELTVLLNEEKKPGKYTVAFDGANLASGLYFYQINAGLFKDTKAMLLVK